MLLALSSSQKLGLALAAAAFVVFALVSAMLVPRYRPDFPARRLGWFVAACVLFTVGMLAAVVVLAKESEEEPRAGETVVTETTETGETTTTETGGAAGGGAGTEPVGKVVFTTNCGACHTLADADTGGTVGPNLDQAAPSEEKVVTQVTNGGGAMPPFKDTLSEEQIAEVAAYVSAVTGT